MESNVEAFLGFQFFKIFFCFSTEFSKTHGHYVGVEELQLDVMFMR